MKKLISLAGSFVMSLFVGVFLWDNVPCARKAMQITASYSEACIEKSRCIIRKLAGCERIRVFERKFSPEQVLSFFPEHIEDKVSAELIFIPHVLMQVRFSQEDIAKKTVASQEGEILWNLSNGEVVLSTATWSYSKGFRECLLLKADKQDVYVIQALANLGGVASQEALAQALSTKNVRADKVIKSCHKKKLIFTSKNKIGSHFQQLQLVKGCTTNIQSAPVWLRKPKGSKILTPCFTEDCVCKLAGMVFGDNFLILNKITVFVPIYKVSIETSDGSTRVEYIHAVTGKVSHDF